MSMDHVLDHALDHVLDYMIIGFVTTALHILMYYYLFLVLVYSI